jgi:hypothetical protein
LDVYPEDVVPFFPVENALLLDFQVFGDLSEGDSEAVARNERLTKVLGLMRWRRRCMVVRYWMKNLSLTLSYEEREQEQICCSGRSLALPSLAREGGWGVRSALSEMLLLWEK